MFLTSQLKCTITVKWEIYLDNHSKVLHYSDVLLLKLENAFTHYLFGDGHTQNDNQIVFISSQTNKLLMDFKCI